MKPNLAIINGPMGHVEVTYNDEKLQHIVLYRGQNQESIPATPPPALTLLIDFIKNFPQRSPSPLWKYLDLSNQTEFSKQILHAVFSIPTGERRSYGEIAKLTGHPAAARAVGSVMRRNAFPLVIACHRVVKSDGSLGAYCGVSESSGNETRRELTKLEILRIEQQDQDFVLMQEEIRI